MQYKIVHSSGYGGLYNEIKTLEEVVQELCTKGWQPQGGVSVATEQIGYNTRYTLCQAMIKGE